MSHHRDTTHINSPRTRPQYAGAANSRHARVSRTCHHNCSFTSHYVCGAGSRSTQARPTPGTHEYHGIATTTAASRLTMCVAQVPVMFLPHREQLSPVHNLTQATLNIISSGAKCAQAVSPQVFSQVFFIYPSLSTRPANLILNELVALVNNIICNDAAPYRVMFRKLLLFPLLVCPYCLLRARETLSYFYGSSEK